MNQIRVEENKIYAGAGALLSKIAAAALADSLTGFEFAAGIPGTLGRSRPYECGCIRWRDEAGT